MIPGDIMQINFKKIWILFASTFYISAFTFGGGYIIVPLMRKRFVEELAWIEEEEMMDFVALAQSAPGAVAINTSLIIGYRCMGLTGALTTVIGTSLPPLIIITAISFFYDAFIQIAWIRIFMFGMKAGVAAIICHVVYQMGKDIFHQKDKIYFIIMIMAFCANLFLKINLVWIIVGCGCFGFSYEYFKVRQGGQFR